MINSFEEDTKFFRSISSNQRSAFRSKVLEIPQQKGNPKMFQKDYAGRDTFKFNGYILNYYFTQKNQKPKAICIFFHGLNSHGNNSGYVGNSLADELGMNVYSLDYKNFGRSQGDCRGLINSIEDIIEQSEYFVQHILQKFQHQPKIFLSGLSLGGSLSFILAVKNPKLYSGIILLSPALRQISQSQYIMKQLAKAIGTLFPSLKLVGQKFDTGTKYEMNDFILSDKLNYTDQVIPGSIRCVLNIMDSLQKDFSKLTTPFIIVQAGADKLVDLFAPLDLEKHSKTKDKTILYAKNMWHSMFNQQEIEQVVPIIVDWVKKRL